MRETRGRIALGELIRAKDMGLNATGFELYAIKNCGTLSTIVYFTKKNHVVLYKAPNQA